MTRGARLRLTLAMGLVFLTACSNEPSRDGDFALARAVATALATNIAPGLAGDGAPAQAATDPQVVNALLEQLPPGPVIRIDVGGFQQSSFAIVAGTNPPYRTFVTFTGQSLTFRGGVVTSTRGFAFDLASAQTGRAPELVSTRGAGENNRVYRYLTPGDDEREFPVRCEIASEGGDRVTLVSGRSFATTRMRETCQAGPFTFNNFYWVASGGRVVKSQQWLSRELGMLTVEHLQED
ncbi:MAG: YjbF family lipoprotein [Pseudomonadota bacterium]